MTTRKKSVSAAIDALTALCNHGALECAADPSAFLESVVSDVAALRAENERLKKRLAMTDRELRAATDAEVALEADVAALRKVVEAGDALELAAREMVDGPWGPCKAYRLARAEVGP